MRIAVNPPRPAPAWESQTADRSMINDELLGQGE
jgi:hypothetical protein